MWVVQALATRNRSQIFHRTQAQRTAKELYFNGGILFRGEVASPAHTTTYDKDKDPRYCPLAPIPLVFSMWLSLVQIKLKNQTTTKEVRRCINHCNRPAYIIRRID